ncbi:MAG: 4Fe-4S dicluster domain-containing protein [Candidatus Omnitrophota bacterium]
MAEKKFTRRDFLKAGGVAVAGATGALAADKAEAFGPPKTKKRMAMAIDLRRCFGCNACSVACKAQFDVPLGVWRSWVIAAEKGEYPAVTRSFIPVLCNHCENTPCLKGCPATAIVRDQNGIIEQREEDCIGCGYCLQTCPYKMRFRHPEKKVANKCNFCKERLEQGLEPACVDTCNAKARIFGDLNDPNSEISKLIACNPTSVLLPEENTQPKVFYIGLDAVAYKKRAAVLRHS